MVMNDVLLMFIDESKPWLAGQSDVAGSGNGGGDEILVMNSGSLDVQVAAKLSPAQTGVRIFRNDG